MREITEEQRYIKRTRQMQLFINTVGGMITVYGIATLLHLKGQLFNYFYEIVGVYSLPTSILMIGLGYCLYKVRIDVVRD